MALSSVYCAESGFYEHGGLFMCYLKFCFFHYRLRSCHRLETTNIKIAALSPGDHEVTVNYLNGFQSNFTLNEKDVCKYLKEIFALFIVNLGSCFLFSRQEFAM